MVERIFIISTLTNVPEGSTYRIRFIVRDNLTGQKSKGGFRKKVDCIDEPVPTTTTTVPVIQIINPSVSNTRDECSGGAKLIHFNMANSDSSNANAYFLTEYSLDENWSNSFLINLLHQVAQKGDL